MSQLTIVSVIAEVFSIMLAGVFGWAAIAKLRNPSATAAAFRSLRLPASGALSRWVPAVEIFVSVSVLVLPRSGAALMLGLLIVFSVVLYHARQFGDIRCGCFGAADTQSVTWVTFVRNVGLGLLALFVAIVAPDGAGSTLTASFAYGVIALTSAMTIALVGGVVLALLDARQRIGSIFGQTVSAQTAFGQSQPPAQEQHR